MAEAATGPWSTRPSACAAAGAAAGVPAGPVVNAAAAVLVLALSDATHRIVERMLV